MKRSPRTRLPLLLALGLAACQAPNHVADLAHNDALYVDVPFVSRSPGDRVACLLPVADARTGALPATDRGFPITYGAEEFWERPVGEMVADVLRRQIEASRLFAAVAPEARPDAVLVQPTLVSFAAGSVEAIMGSSSFADVGLRVVVLGPTGADGERPVWHDRVYQSRQTTPAEVNPVHPFRLVGRALQVAMQKALAGLDGSNVGRSGVPVAGMPGVGAGSVPAPVREASAPGR